MATMVPADADLPDVLPTDRLGPTAVPVRDLRAELRRIPNARNVLTVIGAFLQSFGVVIAAGVIHTWWAYLAAFVLMTRGHAGLNILGHEAAHRLLFRDQRWNDLVGRMLSYPTMQALMAYRRSHFTHHRDEMGPEEPDAGLYGGYPIPADSWRRKLRRDLTGVSGWKNLKGVWFAATVKKRTEARIIIAVQLVFVGVTVAVGRPLVYVVWLASWMTLWKFSNRLRAIAEHGGMERSKDRRRTTHVIRQSRLARYWMVPYHTGWHLAHHVDMGVPWRNLPALHDELVASGWVTPAIEYPSYRAFWRACSAGAPRVRVDDPDHPTGNSYLGV